MSHSAAGTGLRVDQLYAGYGGGVALSGVTLAVPAGGVHTVVGLNGAGKTTLVHALAGLVRPYSGRVELAGRDLAGLPPHRVARAGVRLVPAGRRVFASLRVDEHLRLSYRSAPDNPWTPQRVLRSLPALAAHRTQRAGTLSGGEQQMLAIARALLGGPALLLLDEPAEGLAPAVAAALDEVVAQAAGYGAAVLVTESLLGGHDAGTAPHGDPVPARRLSHLHQGRLAPATTVPAAGTRTGPRRAVPGPRRAEPGPLPTHTLPTERRPR